VTNRELIFAIVLMVLVFSSISTIVRSFFAWRGRAAVPGPQLAALEQRLARLESVVETIGVDSQRLTDGQRFLTQLLADRAPSPAAASAAPPARAGRG
jgi:hypothetical protein